jgi:hypothetical protein
MISLVIYGVNDQLGEIDKYYRIVGNGDNSVEMFRAEVIGRLYEVYKSYGSEVGLELLFRSIK